MSRTSRGFAQLLVPIFGIAFGLVALAGVYKATQNSTENRSKAAEDQTIYKQWEFNGTEAEGWKAVDPFKLIVTKGNLILALQKATVLAGLRNTSVNTTLPKGLKTLVFSLSVGAPYRPTPTSVKCPPPPKCLGRLISQSVGGGKCPLYRCIGGEKRIETSGFGSVDSRVRGDTDISDEEVFTQSVSSNIVCTQEAKLCPDGSAVGRVGEKCEFVPCSSVNTGTTNPRWMPRPTTASETRFIGYIYYKLINTKKFEKPIPFKGIVNGKFQEIKVQFPEIAESSIERIQIRFVSGVRASDTILVDWIRLMGSLQKTTPSPTCLPLPVCPSGQRCPYEVKDGCKITPVPSCIPKPSCPKGAYCMLAEIPGVTYCPSTPTPTACGPIACKVPPKGCRYIQSTPCSCGTLICEVVTSMPTFTPTTTPLTPVTTTYTPTPSSTQHIITVTAPNGGETLTKGQSYTITWNSSHTFTDVTIYYSTGGFSGPIATKIQDTGSFVWQANPVYGLGQYKIYINGDNNGYNYANDSSDAFFTIAN